MRWLKDFQFFLFDMDGLLVNTEILHYQAYIEMLHRRGYKLEWTFLKYLEIAHLDDDNLRNSIYMLFPKLFEDEPNWNFLRGVKNKIYLQLLASSKVELMEGVEDLLKKLNEKKINSCVVTNSSKQMTDLIIAKQPLLKTIPHYITREDYIHPKPDPECYLRAIELYSKKGDRIIGFEDSLRGLKALMKTPSICILIDPKQDPDKEAIMTKDVFHFKSMKDLPKDKLF